MNRASGVLLHLAPLRAQRENQYQRRRREFAKRLSRLHGFDDREGAFLIIRRDYPLFFVERGR